MQKKGFTLIEMVAVVAIIGIAGGIFYSTFIMNWMAFEDQLTRLNLWQDANEIAQLLTADGRASRSLVVTSDNNIQTVTFKFIDGSSVDYSMGSDGVLKMKRNGLTTVLSKNVDSANSSFTQINGSLKFTLTLLDKVFGKNVTMTTSSMVFPRCAQVFNGD